MTTIGATDGNDIPTQQNTPDVVDRQAAAKVLYRRAERLFYVQFGSGVVVPVLFAVANLVLPKLSFATSVSRTSVAAWGALYGLIIMLLDELVLDEYQQKAKRTAAIAQEMFDTALFQLAWRTSKIGARLDISEVRSLAQRWRRTNPSFDKVLDWYPPIVRCAPLGFARVLCQRANLTWDSKLRNRYCAILGWSAVSLAILALVVFKCLGLDIDALLLAASTLAPAFRWAIRERRRQLAAAVTLERLRVKARELHDGILTGTAQTVDVGQESRELQDDIFDHRRSAPIGLSWVYGMLRDEFEPAMKVDAEHSIREYRQRRGLTPCEP